jgi:hypothetical protein
MRKTAVWPSHNRMKRADAEPVGAMDPRLPALAEPRRLHQARVVSSACCACRAACTCCCSMTMSGCSCKEVARPAC